MKKIFERNDKNNRRGKMTAVLAAALAAAMMAGCGASPQTQNTTAAQTQAAVTATTEAVKPQAAETTAASAETTAAAVGATAAAGTAASGTGTTATISEDDARQAALTHAGLSEGDVTFINTHLDRDDGRLVYDVEFYSGNSEYDYEIDAATGEIVSYDYDVESYNLASGAGQTQSGEYISETDARNAALTHAGLAEADVTFVKTHLDRDDGRMVYDVEFYSGSSEYDYEIDASTGEIISFDYDAESYHMSAPSGQSQSGDYITVDEAKAAAFTHAGVAETDTTRLKVEMDYDDGRAVYEVEFNVGRTEYNYEIDAVTGDLLSYDMDND